MAAKIKTYSDMVKFQTFEDRLAYLKLYSIPTQLTFGFQRYLNQKFYNSSEWKRVRDAVIIRDLGCDLGLEERPLNSKYILIHHITPITIEDIKQRSRSLTDFENLICVSKNTHNLIHYGGIDSRPMRSTNERSVNDTKLW